MATAPHRLIAPAGHSLLPAQVHALVAETCPAEAYRDQRVLLIIPDGTRTAPVGLMFQALHARLGGVTKKFDVMIALGTHPAMPADAINQRVGITAPSARPPTRRSSSSITSGTTRRRCVTSATSRPRKSA